MWLEIRAQDILSFEQQLLCGLHRVSLRTANAAKGKQCPAAAVDEKAQQADLFDAIEPADLLQGWRQLKAVKLYKPDIYGSSATVKD
jgi:hypothetical protein